MNIIKKHWKISVAAVAVILAVILILCLVPVRLQGVDLPHISGKLSKSGELSLSEHALAPEGMLAAAQDESVILFINKDTGAFSLYDKGTANYWNSNPDVGQIESSGAMGTIKSEMSSQLVLTYYDENGLQQFFNTYEHSALNGNVSLKSLENGVAVTYEIGEDEILISMLPVAIEKEKFDKKILEKLSPEQKETVLNYYDLKKISSLPEEMQKKYIENFPNAEKESEYYFLNLTAPDYALPKIYDAVFNFTEYTSEDMKQDNEQVGYKGESETLLRITVTVEYTVENGELCVRIPAEEIIVPDNLYLTDIEVLPFFGNADTYDTGYMFVPDGSGGIINLNNGRTQTSALEIPVYGIDGSLSINEKNVSAATANIPVFAMVKNNSAFMGIIENGDAIATVCSRVSGSETNLNQVYPSFCVLPNDAMVIKTSKEAMSTNLYQDTPYSGDITVRYSFYGEDGANYSALANAYRTHLIKNGVLTENDTKNSLYVSLTGRIEVEKSLFGVNYNSYETVTSFEEAELIAKELKKAGVEEININFRSWHGGGLANDIPVGASPAMGMGGKEALKRLDNLLGDNGDIALGTSSVRIWKGLPFINTLKYSNRYLTNKTVKGYSYNIATNLADEKAHHYFSLNTRYLSSMIEKYSSAVEKMGDYSLWLEDAGNVLSSDFRKKAQLNRTASMQLISDALSSIKEDKKVVLSAPNLYAFASTDTALALPIDSSENYIINRSVPFLQIVLSGCVDYTVPSINGTGDAKANALKAVETGSMLYFDWIYASDEDVADMKGKEPAEMFSKNYKNWVELAASVYKRQKAELENVAEGAILSHEKLCENVYKTVWKNGYVIVNYSDKDIMIDGINIPAEDFKVLK